MIAAVVFRCYLPPHAGHQPYSARTPSETEPRANRRGESLVDFSDLLGQARRDHHAADAVGQGARFNGRLVDVTARGEVIDRGVEVIVAEVRGNHVVVQPA